MGRCTIFFSSRLVFRDILIMKQRCDQHLDKVKTWGSGFYLLKKRREGRSECLFGVLPLLKIGLEISFSYELSPWCKILWVFSQWPHLSELEHHSRYSVYRLARRSWSAAHSCWLLEDSDHHPAKSRSQRLQVKDVKMFWEVIWLVPHSRLIGNCYPESCNIDWPICRIYALAIQTTIGWKE